VDWLKRFLFFYLQVLDQSPGNQSEQTAEDVDILTHEYRILLPKNITLAANILIKLSNTTSLTERVSIRI